MNTNTTSTMSTIYWSLLAVLMTFACLIATDIISPQNAFFIAAAVISVIGAIVCDMYKKRRAVRVACYSNK